MGLVVHRRVAHVGRDAAARGAAGLHRLDVVAGAGAAGVPGSGDVANALISRGYNDREVAWAVAQLPAGASVTEGIRQALKLLSKS